MVLLKKVEGLTAEEIEKYGLEYYQHQTKQHLVQKLPSSVSCVSGGADDIIETPVAMGAHIGQKPVHISYFHYDAMWQYVNNEEE